MDFLNNALKTFRSKAKDKKKETDNKMSEVKIDSEKEIKKDGQKEVKKVSKENTKDAYKILIRPLISEKASAIGKLNQFVFIVGKKANKPEIKKAIEAVYGISPIKVNVIHVQGKCVRFGKSYGRRKDWKKAIITLPKGKSIQLYEGI